MTEGIERPEAVAENLDKRQHLLPDELPLLAELAHLSREEQHHLDRRLTKILDLTLMPAVFILFLLTILDRNNIASARISGLTTTQWMTNYEYNTCLLMFYIGYCITQVPSNMTIGKVRPSLYICLMTSLWGILSMSQGFTKDFSQLAAVRFILGRVEAPFIPAAFVLVFDSHKSHRGCCRKTSVGKQDPQNFPVVLVLTLLIGMALYHRGLHNGRNCHGLASSAHRLSSAVQALVFNSRTPVVRDNKRKEYRVRKENAGIVDEDPEPIWRGLRQALVDPKLYMFAILQMALITAQSFSIFFPSIVRTLGYDREKTLLLTSPPYFFAFIVSIAVSFQGSSLSAFVTCLLGRLLDPPTSSSFS
ncbi:MFS general substrate transporter [Apiospora aurea]|uniref:MFS general substrate transporter n=1 Tax=Apiospora aurea TaxID=335848 RepID=A0ABR1QUC5_9PEZI